MRIGTRAVMWLGGRNARCRLKGKEGRSEDRSSAHDVIFGGLGEMKVEFARCQGEVTVKVEKKSEIKVRCSASRVPNNG